MKLCRFQQGSGRPRVGLLADDETILDLSAEGIDRLTSLFEFEGLAAQLGALTGEATPVEKNVGDSALAGFVEPGETIEDCIRREVREEVGLALARMGEVFVKRELVGRVSIVQGELAEHTRIWRDSVSRREALHDRAGLR